jgi:hypothetical protein
MEHIRQRRHAGDCPERWVSVLHATIDFHGHSVSKKETDVSIHFVVEVAVEGDFLDTVCEVYLRRFGFDESEHHWNAVHAASVFAKCAVQVVWAIADNFQPLINRCRCCRPVD